MASLATAQDFINQHVIPNSLTVVQIEEDWELVVGETDQDVTAPQVTTAMSPRGDVDSLHAIFNLNHQALDVLRRAGCNCSYGMATRRSPTASCATARS